MKKHSHGYPVPAHQADATLSQGNPVSGTEYEVLATTRNVRILGIAVKCTWTVQPSPLEIHITIDGQVLTYIKTDPVSDQNYAPTPSSASAPDANILGTSLMQYRAFLLEGRSIAVTAEITGGTVSNLSARVKYARW